MGIGRAEPCCVVRRISSSHRLISHRRCQHQPCSIRCSNILFPCIWHNLCLARSRGQIWLPSIRHNFRLAFSWSKPVPGIRHNFRLACSRSEPVPSVRHNFRLACSWCLKLACRRHVCLAWSDR